MSNKDRIIVMTKMAVYDKTYGQKDKKANDYFRHDFIYKKNFWSRLLSLFGCLIIFLFYIVDKIFVKGEDIFNLDFKGEGIKAAFFIIAVLAVYTVISSLVANREYNDSQRRIKKQLALMNLLDVQEEDYSSADQIKEDTALNYGTDAFCTGNTD